MQSAFGIDHGEISKVKFQTKKQQRAVKAERQRVAAEKHAKSAARAKSLKAVPGKMVNAKISVADIGRGASNAANSVGRLASAKPGLTGAAVIGGSGYGAYRGFQNSNLPKRKRQS